MTIIDQVIDAIKRHPHIDRVIVSASEFDAMREEYIDLMPGGPPPGPERRFWISQARQTGSFHIMGRPVMTPEQATRRHQL